MSLVNELLKARGKPAILTVLTSIATILAILWWNAQLGGIIDKISAAHTVSTKTIVCAGGAILLCAILSFGLALLSGYTCELLAHDLRMAYARHFSQLSLPQIENINAGEQASRLQNELNEVSAFLRANLFSLVDDSIRFVGTFCYLLWLNPGLTLLANLPSALLMVYITIASKRIGIMALKSQQANLEMSGFAGVLTALFPITKLFSAGPLLLEKHNAALDRWERATIREERTKAALMSPSGALSFIPLLLIFLIGGMQVIRGEATLGSLYIFINLPGNISGVLMNMPGRIAGFRRFAANMARIAPYVDLQKGGDKAK